VMDMLKDMIMDAHQGGTQPVGVRESNAAELHTRLVVEIPKQDIMIMMKSGEFICRHRTRGSVQ